MRLRLVRISGAVLLLCIIGSALHPATANAWGLRTHLWIGQQVLNDALDDGHVTLAGRNYPVPSHVLQALRQSGERYLMGHLGPDVFPDPVVGQTTTHPGIENGWQTDRWLNQLLANADETGEIAFAYGFAGHASGDIFAHTYVNAYAGSVFDLSSEESGRVVERRHFVLEKYIEGLTPKARNLAGQEVSVADLRTTTSFLRDQLVLNRDASRQYANVPTAAHLNAMFNVRRGVGDADREFAKVVDQLTGWGADYLRQQAKLAADVASGRQVILAAQAGLEYEQAQLAAREATYAFALRRLDEARDIVRRNPELILVQQRMLAEQTQAATAAAAEAARVAADVNREIESLRSRVAKLRDSIIELACWVLVVPDAIKKCKKKVKGLNAEISRIERQISGARERQRTLENAAREAAVLRDNIGRELNRLEEELTVATRNLADGTYAAAVAVAETDLAAQRILLDQKRRVLVELEEIQRGIQRELSRVTGIVDELQRVVADYNPITLILRNWVADIDQAGEEYIKAGHRAGVMMATNEGNPLTEYTTWWQCYGGVFTGTPIEVGQAGCAGMDYLSDVDREISRVIDRLPEYLRWVIRPTREASRLVRRELQPHLMEAGIRVVAFITDETTADFLALMINPENATRAKLVSVYAQDGSGLRLIRFDDVAALVDRDLAIRDGVLDPTRFAPLAHSVTLAKLALLGPDQLNQLVKDLAGTHVSPLYGEPLYAPVSGNFTLLLGSVRSIDGNHQWQAYGLPHPRRLGVSHAHPREGHFGHDYYANPSNGFRIWVDPYLREKVFLKLFPVPVIGALTDRGELQWPAYRFPSCAGNPFPTTQNRAGQVLSEDRTCAELAEPDRGPTERPFSTADEYRSRYFQCEVHSGERRYSVVIGSSVGADWARDEAVRMKAQFPDMHFDVQRRQGKGVRWAVTAGQCLPEALANEAQDVVLSRRIALDVYLLVDRP